MAFNTAISAMMEFVNEAYRVKTIHKSQAERFVLILSSFAPHLGEELWQRLRGDDWKESLAYASWPSFDPTRVVEAEVEVPIQINGKLVGRVTVAKDADEETVRKVALADEKVTARIGSAAIVKTIHVPGRMMNLIVK
ncbi:MAG: class I tRNA ligase family protein [Phycisphaerales bacterium]|nr:class I tRNA ligase family protein [Phycisphaerales bacterium]